MKKKFTSIDLFCGCGGLSLGLKSAGFDLIFANELSPMAAETFGYNLIEDARDHPSPEDEYQELDKRTPPHNKYFTFIKNPKLELNRNDWRIIGLT